MYCWLSDNSSECFLSCLFFLSIHRSLCVMMHIHHRLPRYFPLNVEYYRSTLMVFKHPSSQPVFGACLKFLDCFFGLLNYAISFTKFNGLRERHERNAFNPFLNCRDNGLKNAMWKNTLTFTYIMLYYVTYLLSTFLIKSKNICNRH